MAGNNYIADDSHYFTDFSALSGAPDYVSASQPAPYDESGEPIRPDDALNFTTDEIGTTTNPMGNTLQSLKERIQEGTGRIEFSFIGQGKGNSQQPTPESFGEKERADMRELLKINQMKSSTHAGVHNQSLAGFSPQNQGFDESARSDALKEIKKAIDFAGEATKGGPVVFHFSEWQRGLTEAGRGGKDEGRFKAYDEEEEKSPAYVVDQRTGKLISGLKRDEDIHQLKYYRAKDKADQLEKDSKGNFLDMDGNPMNPDDWVSVDNRRIPKDETEPTRLFERVPVFNEESTSFETEKLGFQDLKKRAEELSKKEGRTVKPEEVYARIQFENRAHQARGSSLFHARGYKADEESLKNLIDRKEKYERLKESLPEHRKHEAEAFIPEDVKRNPYAYGESNEEILDNLIKFKKDSLRHIHEASGSADVQAKEYEEVIKNMKPADEYGKDKTAQTVADAALYAREKYNKNRDKYGLEDPIYVAPENWDPKLYGSHPDEFMEAIDKSRQEFKERLRKKGVQDEKKLEEEAKKHIRGTLDVGHLNMFRHYFENREDSNLSEEDKNKKFEEWMMKKTEELFDKDKQYVGHVHLSDNFGFDDEHLTPGQGNIPMKKFLKKMEDLGVDDMIVETGSFNIQTAVPDTLSMIGSPVYGVNKQTRFNQVRNAQFGYQAPGMFIAGAYTPSNEWKMWSDVPLE